MTFSPTIATVTYAALCVLMLLINWKYKLDADAGGYVPRLTDKANYPKFFVHCVVAFALCVAAVCIGVPPKWALIITIIAGVLYEPTQGFFNWLDVVADIVGVCLAFGFLTLLLGLSHVCA